MTSSQFPSRFEPARSARRALAASAIGFALTSASIAEPPAGPGAVFASVEAAALDALQFAALQQGDSRRELGGAIERTERGYRYGAPRVGSAEGVRVALRSEHVAWFYTHGARADAEENRLNEGLSRRDRQMVDRIDPRHRPLFVRTPSGRVLRYGDGRLAVVGRAPAKVAQRD